ncbi:MAG: transglycosylase domain-containing protein [Actinobacteria bacterium]|nr:transglycosylase domain-containing protein [Actinomycetota bacterium]
MNDRRITRRQRSPLIVVLLLALTATGCGDLVEIRPLRPVDIATPNRPTVVVDAQGQTLAELAGDGLGHPIALAQVAPTLVDAVIAVEDVRFHEHDGIDLRALGRAFVRNVRSARVVEGGSTITQQLAKNTATGSARTIQRKVAEASVAWQLEQELSKDEILERYLNSVYLGNGAYGVEAAAREYFGRPAADLDLAQSALLAGMLRSPGRYDPRRHPDAARRRRDVVLRLLRDQGRIAPAEATAARATPITVGAPRPRSWSAAYFVDHVLDQLQHDPAFAVLGDTPQARAMRVFSGGLRVETTLDPDWQAAAEDALQATLSRTGDPDGALVAIEPSSGAIGALVGGRDYFGDGAVARFNLATDARRQPGSTFKPIVLAAALRAGHSLDDRFDAPARVRLDPVAGEPEPWTVSNYGDTGFGRIDLHTATTWSVNVVYAKLIDEVGAEQVATLAADLGVRTALRPYRSLALGAQEVTVLDMASAQATLAAGGVYRRPLAVTRILEDDTVLFEHAGAEGRRVLDQSVAMQVTAAMRDVVATGTGVRADAKRPLAGKTGTTQDGADAWFVGYTPDMAAATWIGFHEARIPMVPPRTRATVEGGTWPAEAFARFTLAALRDVPAHDFTVRIPDVTTGSADRARRRLARAGFDVAIVEEHSPSLPPGIVLRQDPPAGARVSLPTGYRVEVTVSSTTPVSVVMPDVLGLDSATAVAHVRAAGLVPQLHHICPGGSPTCTGAVERADQVWEHEPAAGASLHSGDRVTLRAFPAAP